MIQIINDLVGIDETYFVKTMLDSSDLERGFLSLLVITGLNFWKKENIFINYIKYYLVSIPAIWIDNNSVQTYVEDKCCWIADMLFLG